MLNGIAAVDAGIVNPAPRERARDRKGAGGSWKGAWRWRNAAGARRTHTE